MKDLPDSDKVQETEFLEPIDGFVNCAIGNGWEVERASNDRCHFVMTGTMNAFQATVEWFEGEQLVMLTLAHWLECDCNHVAKLCVTINSVNEKIRGGSFYYHQLSGALCFRWPQYAGSGGITTVQVNELLEKSWELCQEHFPQFVWASGSLLTGVSDLKPGLRQVTETHSPQVDRLH